MVGKGRLDTRKARWRNIFSQEVDFETAKFLDITQF